MRNELYLKEMGKKIKAIRKMKKITLDRLSHLCTIDVSALSFIENGKRNAHILTLKSIAEVLEVDVKDFI